jgi:hypothetical protein
MKQSKKILQFMCIALALCNPVMAQESESSVPLLLGLESGNAEVKKITMHITGREVAIRTDLINNEATARNIGWYASTPLFSVLGTGETYDNKTFADVRATYNGKAIKPYVYQQGYFMGHDISAELARVGLAPLPNLNSDPKKLAKLDPINEIRFVEWQGRVNYAWTAPLPSLGHIAIEVTYRALPEFALVEVDSYVFGRVVQQHCGDPRTAMQSVKATNAAISQVIIERYEVPIAYLRVYDVDISIVQPRTNWLDARPVLSLACGLKNADQRANVRGTISNASSVISILVLSVPNDLPSARRK